MNAQHVRGMHVSSEVGSRRHWDLSRRGRALSLLPVALLSAAWTVGLSSSDKASATRSTELEVARARPILTAAGDQSASVPVPGMITPAVSYAAANGVISSADAWGIPSHALASYQRAAQIIDFSDPTCHLPWEMLAAIGRVESDHGRFGGSVPNANGVSTPGIYGPELDGGGGTQAIPDTDAGQVDHDPSHDRAVGPMQFIPATWSALKVDGDGDGVRDPQDIDDAALAAAVYLCSGGEDLTTSAGRQAVLFRYNRSSRYVALVLRLMDAYSADGYAAVPAGTYGGTLLVPSTPEHSRPSKQAKKPKKPNVGSHDTPATGSPEPVASGPAAPKPAAPQAPKGKGSIAGLVGGIVTNPASAVGTAVPEVLTQAQATVACIEGGLSALDVLALTRCVTNLLTP